MPQVFNPEYLRRVAESPEIRALKNRGYRLLHLSEGASVLDLGCGPATDTPALSKLVGAVGRVVGVDSDPEMVKEADRIAVSEAAGSFNIRHIAGNASQLAFSSAEFDACFSDRLFQHIPWLECVRAVREIRRVPKPRGRVVLIDSDWGTLSVGAPDPFLERRVVQEHLLGFAQPFSGRHLPGLMKSAGILDLSIHTFDLQLSPESVRFLLTPSVNRAVAKGVISPAEAQAWHFGLASTEAYGLFFAHLSMVMVAGRNGE
jgi:SAM-dependent methyltransferase